MKVIENKDCRVIAVTMQGIVITEYSGVIMQIDQSVIKRAAEELGLLNYSVVHEPDEVEKLTTQLESALATCDKANETIKQLKSSLADRQTIVSKHSKKIEEQERILKDKDRVINNLRKDIDSGDKLIEELTFQRDAAKDSVVQLEKQLNETLAKLEEQQNHKDELLNSINAAIEDKNKTISKLSQEIKNYEETGAYILRYVITDGNIIIDNAKIHEPIVCADPETAATALRNLCNETDYAAVFKCCDTSRYNIGFNSECYVISCLDSHDSIEISNRAVAYNLYNLLRLGSITISDIRNLIGEKK